MWNAKRVAVAALAALMIAGAVPALASEDASVNLPARQETAVQTHKRARKPARQSVASGDTTATSGGTAARPSRKPSRRPERNSVTDAVDTPAESGTI